MARRGLKNPIADGLGITHALRREGPDDLSRSTFLQKDLDIPKRTALAGIVRADQYDEFGVGNGDRMVRVR